MENKFKWICCIDSYQRYLKGDKSVMQEIYDYNEDDCRATKQVLESLKEF